MSRGAGRAGLPPGAAHPPAALSPVLCPLPALRPEAYTRDAELAAGLDEGSHRPPPPLVGVPRSEAALLGRAAELLLTAVSPAQAPGKRCGPS